MRTRSALCLPPSAFRAGYSFTEVMFAVVVLGIGFIMIAAMFPVALSQSKSTADETVAATIARGAVSYLESIADDTPAPGRPSTMPPTDVPLGSPQAVAQATPARVAPFIAEESGGALTPAMTGSWEAIRGSLILPDDPRFAFVPMYRRETGSQTAHVIVIVVQSRARSRYDNTDTADATPGEGNLQPRPVEVTVLKNAGGLGIHWIRFADTTALPGARNAAAEGAYVVIANDPGNGPSPVGAFNGRIYRLGLQATEPTGPNAGRLVPNTWTFQPGSEYVPQPGTDGVVGTADDWDLGPDADAYIVGRENAGGAGSYTGPAQDVSVYSTFITVKP